MIWTGRWVAAAAVAGMLTTGWAEDAKPRSPAREMARLLNQAFIEVAEEVSPAVVVIDVAQREEEVTVPPSHPWFDLLPERFRRKESEENPKRPPEFNGQGSGIIMDSEGHILTNHHVVEGAERIRIRLRDGRQFDATVRGSDEQSDLAVVQIQNFPADLPVARLGDSDRVRVGEFAIAIGAPFRLDYSVTYGHVSAKGRNSVVPMGMGGALMDQDFLQTDASINPGNSGGPLVNIDGEVIGINSMIRGLNSGISFSIPINLAREISTRLIKDGRFVRSWLGIGIDALRENEKVQALVPGLADGVVVTRIVPTGPASGAVPALRPNDVITAVDGKPVKTPTELRALVTRKLPGTSVSLDVRRAETTFVAKVEPQAMPDDLDQIGRPEPKPQPEPALLGMRLKPLSPAEADEKNLEGGLVVVDLPEKGPVVEAGVRPGDIITEVNHQSVDNPLKLAEVAETIDGKKDVVLVVNRKGEEVILVIKSPK
ncbi:MAG: trypsin-like peptidase domain-containing protein [Verrucomicrobia bacterium]|nr:trypsin-like peptidase domain-containing protein [Verrucomicrobiota bacterium]